MTRPLYAYTVLLLRPDYVADTFGQDTYMTHVSALSVAAAQAAAQQEAAQCDNSHHGDGGGGLPEDYHVLAVFEGNHNDIKETS